MKWFGSFFLVFLVMPSLVFALSADEIRQMQYEALQQEKKKNKRLNSSTYGAGVDEEAEQKNQSKAKPQQKKHPARKSNKYSASQQNNDNDSNTGAGQEQQPQQPQASLPRPAPRPSSLANQQGGAATYYEADISHSVRFGIPIGVHIKAEIRSQVSSASPALVEIYVTEDVIGSKRTLPAGTTLFATPSVNGGTRRMDFKVVKGRTPAPENYEFALNGIVKGEDGSFGVSAIFHQNDEAVAQGGVNVATEQASRTFIKSIAGDNGVGRAISEGAGRVIDDKARKAQKETDTSITAYAGPQKIKIRVEKTF